MNQYYSQTRILYPELIKKFEKVFKSNFRNISRIMDCVSCQKCRLWGKIQTFGLGTALKILYTFNSYYKLIRVDQIKLNRQELVALINTFHRIAESVALAKDFERKLLVGDSINSIIYGSWKFYIGVSIAVLGVLNMLFGRKRPNNKKKQ